MFELRVKVDFPAAHRLVGYPGDCDRLHGHNWVLEVFAQTETLDSLGMAMDFRDLKNAAKELVAVWDHQYLNDLPDFKTHNPSAEVIAQLAYHKLAPLFAGSARGTRLDRVTVWENDRCSATYWPSPASRTPL